MLRSVATGLLALALGVLPVMQDVCGPECQMGDAPVIVGVATAADDVAAEDRAECPLHPAQEQAPAHESDGCTHDHGAVREAPDSPSALAPSIPQSLDLRVAVLSWTSPHIGAPRQGRAIVSPSVDRAPQRLALRV